MSKFELLRQVERECEQLVRQRRIRQLADGLMLATGIVPHAQDLVVWLGNRNSRTNRDAVIHWITQELASSGSDPGADELAPLRRHLNLRLHEILEMDS